MAAGNRRWLSPERPRVVLQHLEPSDHPFSALLGLSGRPRRGVAKGWDRLVAHPLVVISQALMNNRTLLLREQSARWLYPALAIGRRHYLLHRRRSTRGSRTMPVRSGSIRARPRASRASEFASALVVFAVERPPASLSRSWLAGKLMGQPVTCWCRQTNFEVNGVLCYHD